MKCSKVNFTILVQQHTLLLLKPHELLAYELLAEGDGTDSRVHALILLHKYYLYFFYCECYPINFMYAKTNYVYITYTLYCVVYFICICVNILTGCLLWVVGFYSHNNQHLWHREFLLLTFPVSSFNNEDGYCHHICFNTTSNIKDCSFTMWVKHYICISYQC